MLIGRISGATRVLGKAQGYLGLPLRDSLIDCPVNGPNTPAMTTAWLPNRDEIDAIRRGAAVYVTILGTAHPPMLVKVGEPPETTTPMHTG